MNRPVLLTAFLLPLAALADHEAPVHDIVPADWQRIGIGGFVGLCLLFAPFISKLLIAWWSRKRGDDGHDAAGPARTLTAMHARLDDLTARLKEHSERDSAENKEALNAVCDLHEKVRDLEVAIAKLSRD